MAAPASMPGWYVISLRPAGGHDGLRRAAARMGGGLLALSPWRIEPRTDPAARAALRAALDASRVVFTSPAAVRAAAALQALDVSDARMLAVGAGTAAALRRAGVREVRAPERMDSEGLLDLPALRAVEGEAIGLVTAPGGRDLIASMLRERGAEIRRAEVYARVDQEASPAAVARLRALRAPAVVAVSSGAALARILDALPADAARKLRTFSAVAASPRLGEQARALGFVRVAAAAGPRPAQLVAAAEALLGIGDATDRHSVRPRFR
jgi:uroporphyrinogen-III synthase